MASQEERSSDISLDAKDCNISQEKCMGVIIVSTSVAKYNMLSSPFRHHIPQTSLNFHIR